MRNLSHLQRHIENCWAHRAHSAYQQSRRTLCRGSSTNSSRAALAENRQNRKFGQWYNNLGSVRNVNSALFSILSNSRKAEHCSARDSDRLSLIPTAGVLRAAGVAAQYFPTRSVPGSAITMLASKLRCVSSALTSRLSARSQRFSVSRGSSSRS